MKRTFLLTVTTFDSEQFPVSKYAIVSEYFGNLKVYRLYTIKCCEDWMRANKVNWADYTSAKVALDKILEKQLKMQSIIN